MDTPIYSEKVEVGGCIDRYLVMVSGVLAEVCGTSCSEMQPVSEVGDIRQGIQFLAGPVSEGANRSISFDYEEYRVELTTDSISVFELEE